MDGTKSSSIILMWYDYIIIILVMLASTLIGVYYGWLKQKSQTVKEYLQGGNQMSSIPVGLSVAVSVGVFILFPVQVYKFGSNILWMIPAFFVIAIVGIYVFVPIFFKLKLTTVFEYLEKRFDSRTKSLAIVFYVLRQTLQLSFIIHFSALVYATGSKVDPFVISIICTIVCVFYTAIGGLKTVVWSDIFQFALVIITFLVVLVAGFQSVGGLRTVLSSAWHGDRFDIFDFDLDPTKRDSFWIIFIGFGIQNFYDKIIDQAAVQKYLAVAKYQDCAKSILYAATSVGVVFALTALTGLTIYARYQTCDPLTSQKNFKHDQLVPYFILDVGKNMPGISGLFVAGILSAGISSISSFLNAISGIIYTDLICKFYRKRFSDATAKHILKLIIVVEGLLSIGISFLLKNSKEIFGIVVGSLAVFNGPLLGITVLGVLFPKANSQGAFYGSLCALLVSAIMSGGSMYYQKKGLIRHSTKPMLTTGCHTSFSKNTTFSGTISTDVPYIFRISFYYSALVGVSVTIIISLVISYVCGKNSWPVDKKLLFSGLSTQKFDHKNTDTELEPIADTKH